MLTESIKQEILTQAKQARTPRCVGIDALLIAKEHYGWISDECLKELAELLDMTAEELDGVATFYNHVYRKPVGKHVILVCDSVSCWIMGYEGVREYLSKRLSIDLGETTSDGRFTLLPIQCLGACDRAPAMMIDDELYCELNAEKIDEILRSYA
jgi:NADH-quinone oxidoreductase subunit E